ncbi:lipase family protein [uncultured Corynebacterium sp.]|uniref:lipase family protein n=1 Tax=uncultured Corynebacterium sp. TaxID=159447 RepID=UPI0025F4006C|nr:lipase family protein [uncultured Corynebacterium sp.]
MVSPRGREILDAAAVGCNDDVAAQFGEASTAEMMLGGRPLEEAMLGGPVGASAMADQRIGAPGSPLPTAPVMIISGPRDGLVEYGQAKRLVRDWQAAGGAGGVPGRCDAAGR